MHQYDFTQKLEWLCSAIDRQSKRLTCVKCFEGHGSLDELIYCKVGAALLSHPGNERRIS